MRLRFVGVLLVVAMAGCWDIDSEQCGDRLCPIDTVCYAAEGVCVSPDQICAEVDDTPCLFGDRQEQGGLCVGGLCRPFQCQAPIVDGRDITLDPGEECELGAIASCLDIGFDRGRAGCDDSCQHDTRECALIGWDTQVRGANVLMTDIAITPTYTLAAAANFTDPSASLATLLRRELGEDRFEFIDASAWSDPNAAAFVTALAVDGDLVYATSNLGLLGIYNGSSWQVDEVAGRWFDVAAVDGVAWAVGAGPSVVRFKNGGLTPVRFESGPKLVGDADTDRPFRAVWLESATSGFAVGAQIIARLDVDGWTEVAAPPEDLVAVVGRSMTEVYALSEAGDFGRIVGNQFVPETRLAGAGATLALFEGEIFIGTSDQLLRWDGFSMVDVTPSPQAVSGLVAGDGAVIAGIGNSLNDYRGTAWVAHPDPPQGSFRGVYANNSGDMWFARGVLPFGQPSPVLHFGGLTFEEKDTAFTNATAIGGHSSSVYAARPVGMTSRLFEFVDPAWVEVFDAGAQVIRAVASDGVRTFVVGDAGLLTDINSGSLNSGTSGALLAAHTAPGLPLFVVGDGGYVARVDDGVVTRIEPSVSATLHGVFVAAADDVTIVGDNGTLLHYDGAQVVPVELPARDGRTPTESLRAVHGTSATDVFVVGEEGLILHFDGVAWTHVRSDAGALEDVFVLPTLVTFVGPGSQFHQLARAAP